MQQKSSTLTDKWKILEVPATASVVVEVVVVAATKSDWWNLVDLKKIRQY